MKNELKIEFVDDECVEITLGDLVFRVDLDESGLPKFPELQKEKLTAYMLEMIEREIKSKWENPNQRPIHIAISHKSWCPEITGMGRCKCNAEVCDEELGEDSGISPGKL